jgi:hypothetical protein
MIIIIICYVMISVGRNNPDDMNIKQKFTQRYGCVSL